MSALLGFAAGFGFAGGFGASQVYQAPDLSNAGLGSHEFYVMFYEDDAPMGERFEAAHAMGAADDQWIVATILFANVFFTQPTADPRVVLLLDESIVAALICHMIEEINPVDCSASVLLAMTLLLDRAIVGTYPVDFSLRDRIVSWPHDGSKAIAVTESVQVAAAEFLHSALGVDHGFNQLAWQHFIFQRMAPPN